jgi:transposase
MKFQLLTDEQWRYFEPLLLPAAKGKMRTDHRRTIDSILCVLKTNIYWNGLSKHASDSTADRRLRRWEKREGVWKGIIDALLLDRYSEDRLGLDSDTILNKKGATHSLRRPQEGQRDEDTQVVNEESAPTAVTTVNRS